MHEDVTWANTKLDEARYRVDGMQRALADQCLGDPRSATRMTFVAQCLAELQAIETDVMSVEKAVGPNEDVSAALAALARDRSRFEAFAGAADPPGTRADMTWIQALRHAEVLGYAATLIDEIMRQVRPGTDEPLGTLFRSDGPFKEAQEFARVELAPRIERLMTVATTFATQAGAETMAERYPDFEYKMGNPPPDFHANVRGLIQLLAPLLFPTDAGYVTGDLFKMLVQVNGRAEARFGEDLGGEATRVTLVDVLFLRGQLPALASYAAGLPRGTVACETLMRTVAMLMTAANNAGPGKIPAGYRPELDAVRFYVGAFMKAMLNRLRAGAAAASAPSGVS